MKRLALAALFGGLLVLTPGTAQDRYSSRAVLADSKPIAAEPAAQKVRMQYAVRNADAEGLAAALAELYQGEAKIIAAPGNAILVGGPPAAVAEAMKFLEQLDRKPRTVEVEVKLVETAAKDGKLPAPEETEERARLEERVTPGAPGPGRPPAAGHRGSANRPAGRCGR